MYRIITCIFIVLHLLIVSGCSDSDNKNNILYGKYHLYSVESSMPVDLNFDEEENSDLTQEINDFSKCALFLYNNEGIISLDLLWPEFLLNKNKLLEGMPSKYEEGMKIDYVNVSIWYFVSFDETNCKIKTGQKKVNDESIYTFNFPKEMNYDAKKKEIYFDTTQTFLLKEGQEGIQLRVVFKYKE